MKCQILFFWEKYGKYFNMSSVENLPRVFSVNQIHLVIEIFLHSLHVSCASVSLTLEVPVITAAEGIL